MSTKHIKLLTHLILIVGCLTSSGKYFMHVQNGQKVQRYLKTLQKQQRGATFDSH